MLKKNLLFIVAILFILSQSVVVNAADKEKIHYRFYFIDGVRDYSDVQPGGTINGKLKISLTTDKKVDFDLSFTPLYVVTGVETLDSWVKLPEGNTVTIDGTPPGAQETTVPFVVSIPKTATPGDYFGMFKLKANEAAINSSGGKTGVSFLTAVGLDLKISIAGERTYKLNLTNLSFNGFEVSPENPNKASGDLIVSYKSTGNSLLSVSANVSATDMFGEQIYKKNYDLARIAPHSDKSESMKIEDIDSFFGYIDIKVELLYSKYGTKDPSSYVVGSGIIRVYQIPWLKILLVFMLICAIVFFILWTRHRFNALRDSSVPYAVLNGDTLQSICQKLNANPKHVIVVNKLQEPYFVNVGMTLLIPKI